MTVINHKSISGITSITTAAGSDDLLTVHTNNQTERLRITSGGQLNLAGNMQFTAANPELEFNNGGPRFRVPSANTLTVHTGGGLGATSNERLRITSAGLVGIGTDAPQDVLTLYDADDNVGMYFQSPNTGNSGGDGLRIGRNNTHAFIWNYENQPIALATQGYERLTILGNGKVGINTNDPQKELQVRGTILKTRSDGATGLIYLQNDGSQNGQIVINQNAGVTRVKLDSGGDSYFNGGRLLVGTTSNTSPIGWNNNLQVAGTSAVAGVSIRRDSADTGGALLVFGKSRGSLNGNTVVQSGDQIGGMYFAGGDGTDVNSIAAQLSVEVDGTPGSNDMPGRILFKTTADGAASPTERLRITSGGKVGMGLVDAGGTGCDPDGNALLIRAASTVGTKNGHIMLTGDSATNGQGPQIVFSESGSGSSFAGAYIGHVRTTTNSVGDLVFGTRATSGDANTVPLERLRITSGGSVNLGTGELTQTSRKLNVYGGAARVTQTSGGNTVEVMGNSTSGQSYGLLCSAGTTDGDYIAEFRQQNGTTKLRIRGDGHIGIANGSPFARFTVGGTTFGGGHGMHANDRVGMCNAGSLTGLMLQSTYNDANHPEYGVVFVQGPNTSSYNVWSISPDAPAKGNSLSLHYGAQNTNIHVATNQKFEFTGEGYFLKPKHPSFCARRSTSGDGRGAASPITEWSNSTTAPCHNIGGHFSHTTGKFTAPVAGMYHFSTCPGYKQSGYNYNVKFRIDSTDVFEPVRFIDGGDDLTSHSTGTGSITVYMTANQTMSVCIAYTHHVNTTYNYFSGHLVG